VTVRDAARGREGQSQVEVTGCQPPPKGRGDPSLWPYAPALAIRPSAARLFWLSSNTAEGKRHAIWIRRSASVCLSLVFLWV
jgi:hypothetical protein